MDNNQNENQGFQNGNAGNDPQGWTNANNGSYQNGGYPVSYTHLTLPTT